MREQGKKVSSITKKICVRDAEKIEVRGETGGEQYRLSSRYLTLHGGQRPFKGEVPTKIGQKREENEKEIGTREPGLGKFKPLYGFHRSRTMREKEKGLMETNCVNNGTSKLQKGQSQAMNSRERALSKKEKKTSAKRKWMRMQEKCRKSLKGMKDCNIAEVWGEFTVGGKREGSLP